MDNRRACREGRPYWFVIGLQQVVLFQAGEDLPGGPASVHGVKVEAGHPSGQKAPALVQVGEKIVIIVKVLNHHLVGTGVLFEPKEFNVLFQADGVHMTFGVSGSSQGKIISGCYESDEFGCMGKTVRMGGEVQGNNRLSAFIQSCYPHDESPL